MPQVRGFCISGSVVTAGRNGRIVYLDPALWYISGGGGLLSLSLQLDEAAAAY